MELNQILDRSLLIILNQSPQIGKKGRPKAALPQICQKRPRAGCQLIVTARRDFLCEFKRGLQLGNQRLFVCKLGGALVQICAVAIQQAVQMPYGFLIHWVTRDNQITAHLGHITTDGHLSADIKRSVRFLPCMEGPSRAT